MPVRCALVAGVLAVLTACGPNAVGTWEGDCEATVDDESIEYELKISVDEVKGGEVEGEGELSVGSFSDDNDIEGDVDGKDIEWTFEVTDDYGDYEVNLEGQFEDGDTIEGDCEVRQKSGGDFLAKGDFKLRRD